jgi:hypothetical protein
MAPIPCLVFFCVRCEFILVHRFLIFPFPVGKHLFSGVLRKAVYTCYTCAPRGHVTYSKGVCVFARATGNKIYRPKLVTDGCQRMFCALAARRRWLLRRRCEINSASRPVKKEEYVFSEAERGKHTAQFRWKAELRLRTRMAIYTLARVAR